MSARKVKRFFTYLGKVTLYSIPMATTSSASTDAETKAAEDQKEMIIGLAAGLGFFVGLILLICFVWCCCCVSKDENAKIVPVSVAASKASSARSRIAPRGAPSRT